MKLNDYLNINHISQGRFGEKLGLTQGYISHIIVGRHTPKGEMAINISAATGWAVSPHELNPVDYPNPTDGLPPDHQSNAIQQ